MAKRIVTKVGDVYQTKETAEGRRYLQLVAIDLIDLNSDVVVVFADQKGADEPPNIEADSEIEFYTHTTVSQGVREGLWEKVGSRAVAVDLSSLVFKSYYGPDIADVAKNMDPGMLPPVPYPNWAVWTPADQERRYVSGAEGIPVKAERGGVFPAPDVLYRIEHGRSEFRSDWPSGAGA